MLLYDSLNLTRNSSGDEIANVNFLFLRRHRTCRTIDLCINSATDRRGYVSEQRFTKFSEITQCNGHYAVQNHSRQPILVLIGELTFKVIQGHWLLLQSIAHIWLPISDQLSPKLFLTLFPSNITSRSRKPPHPSLSPQSRGPLRISSSNLAGKDIRHRATF